MSQMRSAASPQEIQTPDKVEKYRKILDKKRTQLFIKAVFDRAAALLLLGLLSPVMAVVAVFICTDSHGGALFFQTRITQGKRTFRMIKFRTMYAVSGAGELTRANDERITRAGRLLRRFRIDELPQLVNILRGDMSFVGPRPEVSRYTDCLDGESEALFLVRAGLTSRTALFFRNEDELLDCADTDRLYREIILPRKTGMALSELREFSLINDAKTLLLTAALLVRPDLTKRVEKGKMSLASLRFSDKDAKN